MKRIGPGVALRPLNDPIGQRITQCLQHLARVSTLSVRGSLLSGLQRLTAQLLNAAKISCHYIAEFAVSLPWTRNHDARGAHLRNARCHSSPADSF